MPNPGWKSWRRHAALAAGAGLALWAVAAASGYAGWIGWRAELLANFPVCPFLAAGLATWLLARFGGWWPAVPGFAAFAAVAVFTFSPKPGLERGSGGSNTLKFATWNTYIGRLDPARAAAWIDANRPDVIAFTEITRSLHAALQPALAAQYPYYAGNLRDGPGGLAVFSRVPISHWDRPKKSAYATFDLAWPGSGLCRVFVVHPSVPTGGVAYGRRGEVFHQLGVLTAREVEPVIVLGDFNATWASMDFRAFCRAGGLVAATDFRPSWHSALPEGLRIPIDHVLARPRDFLVISTAGGRSGAGSDHLPVLVELAPRPKRLSASR